MNEQLNLMIAEGNKGGTLYITTIRDMFEREPSAVRVILRLTVDRDASFFDFHLKVPEPAGLDSEAKDFLREYIGARIYNIISTYGGIAMTFFLDPSVPGLSSLFGDLDSGFGVGVSKKIRQGYGRALNVAERISDAISRNPPGSSRFEFRQADIRGWSPFGRKSEGPGGNDTMFSASLQGLPDKLRGKHVLGMDIGGSDIKIVLVINGKITAYKEYDWFPALFTRSIQLIEPVLLLARWGRVRSYAETEYGSGGMRSLLDSVSSVHATDEEIMDAISVAERCFGNALPGLDAIGLCFPDVVIRNKIVGGEVYKTRGIRTNPEIDYESDFSRLTDLDELLSVYVRPGGTVKIINDGPMAAFTAAVEMAYAGDRSSDPGVFAHTLGTELGTGWINANGSLPELPLEVYNYIIDLGSRDGRIHHSDDPRSINNFNTGIAGTLQKYISQSGIFRLALKYFTTERPKLYQELFDKGFLRIGDDGSLRIVEQPQDMRKPMLEHLMSLPARGKDEVVNKIFMEIGEFLAVTWLETEDILSTGSDTRILFGRLVKNQLCFSLMCEGARRIAPELRLVVADESSAFTPLMRQLRDDKRYTVAQFAQAVGAVHFVVSSE